MNRKNIMIILLSICVIFVQTIHFSEVSQRNLTTIGLSGESEHSPLCYADEISAFTDFCTAELIRNNNGINSVSMNLPTQRKAGAGLSQEILLMLIIAGLSFKCRCQIAVSETNKVYSRHLQILLNYIHQKDGKK